MFPNSSQRFAVVLAAAAVLSACGSSELVISEPLGEQSFVRVARQGLTADASADGYTTANNENFYLAINKSQLSQKWFMSAYLTQWHPAEALHAARSLGTRVVQFKIQNDKLYVFDATNGTKWSDTLDPQLVVEAYPIITTYAPFNAQSGSQNFVLIDPSAGLNRFEMMGDSFASSYQVRFEVELSFLQRFRTLADGVAYEQVFTGYSEAPGAGILSFDQPFRGSGTMAISLRRYQESAGFAASESSSDFYFKSSNVQYVPNEARTKQNVVKWNIKPGMQPVQWRISQAVDRLKADPRLAGIDVEGAISRGITGWNDAFGFPVFTVVPTTAADSFGDDDKNFVVVDTNPGLGLAFANWRENPNTGEIRGASVYFSSVFLEAALQSAGDAGVAPVVDAGTPVVDAGTPVVDSGTPVFDAGTPVVDAGTPVTDAGTPGLTCAPSIVISEVFGGNSVTGLFNQDFVELHNRSNAAFSLNGYSLQYGSANGTSWQVIPLSGSIPAGGYFLVGLAIATSSDGGAGVAIPTPNLSSSINISGTSGKVAFVFGNTALTGACPTANVGDLLGYGTTNCNESRQAPATSSSSAVGRTDAFACNDTNDNGADFALTTNIPRNGSSPAHDCGCNQSLFNPGGPLIPGLDPSPFGMTVQSNFSSPARPHARFGWAAMPDQHLCDWEAPNAVIPAGMTRKEFIEKYITEVILHEVGHTLGLRHNFKGSLSVSSVMDYNAEPDAVRLTTPGAYDVAAVKYLYGLSPDAPTQAFCTDESTTVDAQCDRFDQGANPLTTDVAVRWKAAMTKQLKGERDLTFADVFSVTRYVRAPATEAQRLEAFNALIGDVAPPLRADVTALSPNAAAYANYYNAVLLLNLFTEPANVRDETQVNPSVQDAAFRARAVQVAKDSLLGSDGNRSWETMRVMVNVLKEMQHGDAMIALTQARSYFSTNRNAYPVASQPYVDDMIRRIDAATTPYFR
ncbi:MAG: zinc-dependent metalloprotease [Archangium sp.]